MKFYSTKNRDYIVDLKTAVLSSLPPDNGLFMPVHIPKLPDSFIHHISEQHSIGELAFTVCKPYLEEDFDDKSIRDIVHKSIDFPAPLVRLDENLYSLELWHGPSLAFKDFGARFMASLMSALVANESIHLHILVATSGDTGGAVAAGFYNIPNIEVTILYPSGKVSPLQEKQLTTLGKNIHALEIQGTFDDCQALVKKAFLDKDLNEAFNLSSANSINVARLIPQMFYYFDAYRQIPVNRQDFVVFCVPSGNFGNLTAGLMAKRMGLPIHKMIAAQNVNNVVHRYLCTGEYSPADTYTTLSNAMDVGNPSNFQRMLDLYGHDVKLMRQDIESFFVNDEETKSLLKSIYQNYGYIADPHGAVGFGACRKYIADFPECTLINLETAHPSKFLQSLIDLGIPVEIPERLKVLEKFEKKAVLLSRDFDDFKKHMLKG